MIKIAFKTRTRFMARFKLLGHHCHGTVIIILWKNIEAKTLINKKITTQGCKIPITGLLGLTKFIIS